MEETTDDAAGIDIELSKKLITAILSIILYGRSASQTPRLHAQILELMVLRLSRQAFPENCFQKASEWDVDHPQTTHEYLLSSGKRLSFKDDLLHVLSPDRQTLVYFRECDNHRLHGLLADLNQIFAALADRLLGKIYICFTNSKEWSKDSLLECYTLKFSYTELGDFHIYLDWTGIDDTPLEDRISEDVFTSLKHVVLGCPPLPSRFYTHLFVSPVDRKTKLEGAWAGNGHGVRESLLHLKGRKGSSGGRVAKFSCEPISRHAVQGVVHEAPDADGREPPEALPCVTTPELPELCSSSVTASASCSPNLAASPARPTSESNGSKEQRHPQKRFTPRPRRQDPADHTSQSSTRSYPEERREEALPAKNFGVDGDDLAQAHAFSGSTLVERPLRRAKKRSASQGHFVPAPRKAEGEAIIAPKYPRLAMIEEIPEDLPPTQRLRTPSQNRQTQISTRVNPMFAFLD